MAPSGLKSQMTVNRSEALEIGKFVATNSETRLLDFPEAEIERFACTE
jgi:hypothetical protein